MLKTLRKGTRIVKVDNRIGEIVDFFMVDGLMYCHWKFLDKPIIVTLKKDSNGKPYLVENTEIVSVDASKIYLEVI